MTINSCVKGKVFEREVAGILRAFGFTGARRGQQHCGGPDSPDVVGIPGFHLECKHVEKMNLYDAMAQADDDAAPGSVPVVVHKRNRRRPVAILDLEHFLRLVGGTTPGAEQTEEHHPTAVHAKGDEALQRKP